MANPGFLRKLVSGETPAIRAEERRAEGVLPSHSQLAVSRKTLSVEVAAERLELTPRQVRRLCEQRKLRARKQGRDWLIWPASVEEYARSERKPGPKPKP